jgi:hypothetical protein
LFLLKNGSLAPLLTEDVGAHRAEPPTEGGWFLVGVFRALDTAKRRQAQATRSRIVPGTFVGRAA